MEEQEHHDNPIYGRKVFFLNPPYSIKKVVLGRLQEMEYEVYSIDDYRDAKNILRHYNDSICFINIDDQLTPDEWLNFISSCSTDDSLKSIFFGVMSEHPRKSDKDMFMLKAAIPAGFISTSGKLDDITDTLKGILEINGAKGRRQYVRTQCVQDKDAMMYYTTTDKMYRFKLIDISSVGAAALLPLQFKSTFQPNSVLQDVSVSLGAKQVHMSAAVFAIKDSVKYSTLVILFIKGTSSATRATIRDYIFESLQKAMLDSIVGEEKDSNDYSNIQTQSTSLEDAFLLDVDPSELTEDYSVHVPPKYDGKADDLTVTNLF